MGFVEKFEHYLRASYSALYVVTSEERRVSGDITRVVESIEGDGSSLEIYYWTCTEGMAKFYPRAEEPDTKLADPQQVLNHLTGLKDDKRYVLMLRDFHHYLKNPRILRKLRDLFPKLKERGCMIVIVAPELVMPPDLERELVVEEYALPDREIISGVLDYVVAATNEDCEPSEKIEVNPHDSDRIIEAALGLTKGEAENVMFLSIAEHDRLDLTSITDYKVQAVQQGGLLEYMHPGKSMEDIGGLAYLKNWLGKRQKAFSQEAREFGLPKPRGILLTGIPGCGKSLAAKATAAAWQVPLLRCDIGAMFGSLVGQTERNVRQMTQMASTIAPCVLWLDEIEKGLAGTRGSGSLDSGVTKRMFGSLVTWMQENEKSVFIFATSNDISALPPELLRKGRFDEIFFIDLPTSEERAEIWKIHIAGYGRDKSKFNLNELVVKTKTFSGAEIENAMIAGLYEAFDEGVEIEMEHLLRAIEETIPLSQTMNNELEALRSWAKDRARPASAKKAQTKTRPGKRRALRKGKGLN